MFRGKCWIINILSDTDFTDYMDKKRIQSVQSVKSVSNDFHPQTTDDCSPPYLLIFLSLVK
jgi:hypothetical protein